MTQQIKVPLLPLPPVEERINRSRYVVLTKIESIARIFWDRDHWRMPLGCAFEDDEILGILPPFKGVDGQIVFEVQK